jgi:hypothetical protein
MLHEKIGNVHLKIEVFTPNLLFSRADLKIVMFRFSARQTAPI